VKPSRAYAQTRSLELSFVILIHAIVAVELRGVVGASTNGMEQSSGLNLEALIAGTFGTALAPIGQGA